MTRFTKSDFLSRLGQAIDKMRKGIKAEDRMAVGPFGTGERVCEARGHASDAQLLIDDHRHQGYLDNPVIAAIEWLSSIPADKPMTLEHLAMVEKAWEYFEEKTRTYVPFLYWDGKQWYEDGGNGTWDHGSQFVFASR